MAQMLFSTSLVAAVGALSPRRLRILNTKKKANICELTFPTAVLSVKLNRKRLVVVLVDQIYVYDISCMRLLNTIETSPNPRALCDLSSADDSVLLYPAPGPLVASPFAMGSGNGSGAGGTDSTVGTVVLFDALNIAPLNIVKAHRAELAAVCLNTAGTLFATASTKGTVIRVFSTLTGRKLAQFRRGSYQAHVHSLAFDLGARLLAVASDTETVHIFKVAMGGDGDNVGGGGSGGGGGLSDSDEESIIPRLSQTSTPPPVNRQRQPSITDRVLKNLPRNITSILEPQRDFAYLKVPSHHKLKRNVVGFNDKDVLVACSDGSLYVYTIPPTGGECVLVKEYALD